MRYAMFGMTIALTVLAAGPLLAADGRDFAGFYRTGAITDLGEHVEVPLTVRVFNYSDADVNGATLRLEDTLIPENAYGSFTGAWIAAGESTRLGGTFLMPRHEYEQWARGVAPHLRIEFTDSAGKASEQMVELAPLLFDEQE